MAKEAPRRLGSGIATAHPDQPLDNTIRITYAPSEHAIHFLRTAGYALFHIDEDRAMKGLEVGSLGTSPSGDVWRKDENGHATMVASSLDLYNTIKIVKKFGDESTLNEFEDRNTGRRILVRTMNQRNPYQLWVPKSPGDTQVLVDAVFCLHFHKSAIDARGALMSEEQILEEAYRTGITFDMTISGEPLIPQLSDKGL